jgi:hypothetical protein
MKHLAQPVLISSQLFIAILALVYGNEEDSVGYQSDDIAPIPT